MKESSKKITPEQLEELKTVTSNIENAEELIIEPFFKRLNWSFGDGEVLTFPQIKSFFEQGMYEESSKDRLSIYIDTVRMLRLYDKNPDDILNLNKYAVEILHNKLISDNQTDGSIDKVRAEKFEAAVKHFNEFNGTYGKIKIENISTLEQLNNEGSSMNHCIASYHDIFINEQYVGFRIFNVNSGERLTLGCMRKPGTNNIFFNQLKAYGNYPASKESCLAIIDFCNHHKILIPESEIFDLMPAISDEMNFN